MIKTSTIRKIFQSDALCGGTAVFPEIHSDRIAGDLRLEEKARARGVTNQPAEDATTLDSVENAVVDQIERYRSVGIQNYGDHKRLYGERLNRVSGAKGELRIVSLNTRSNFQGLVRTVESRLVNAQRQITDAHQHWKEFREKHLLVRAAEEPRIGSLVIVAVFFAVMEAILNSFFLARTNEMGLLGGAWTALLIAVANIIASGLLGWQCRWINRASPFGKLRGYLAMFAFLAFSVTFNLAVAHFRDSLDMSLTMEDAAIAASQAFINSPWGIQSAMSWLLFTIGMLVSLVTALKSYYSMDPYPGYWTAQQALNTAHNRYIEEFEYVIDELTAMRDDAIEQLRDAGQLITNSTSEAYDALYGATSLKAHLNVFLDQCNSKANLLLTRYRDANLAARTAPAPSYFNELYRFADFVEPAMDGPNKAAAEENVRDTEALVNEAIAVVSSEFGDALQSLKKIRSLETTEPAVPRSPGEEQQVFDDSNVPALTTKDSKKPVAPSSSLGSEESA